MAARLRMETLFPLIPWPASLTAPEPRQLVRVSRTTAVVVSPEAADGQIESEFQDAAQRLAQALEAHLSTTSPSPGEESEEAGSFPLGDAAAPDDSTETIFLEPLGQGTDADAEAYRVLVSRSRIQIQADSRAGLFYGGQTLLQLLRVTAPGEGVLPACTIEDAPRFAYRGVMLDVARHFLPPEGVKKVIREIAAYKFNHLHLHLTDDQGWRIEIPEFPELTERSSHSGVGGTGGGCYTAEEIAELVAWGHAHNVTLVPEIDMPGHTAAAGHALPLLNALPYQDDGSSAEQAAPLSEGSDVNISALAVDREFTYEWAAVVLKRVSEMFPGPYLHIGGDEAEVMGHERYSAFIRRVLPLATATGRSVVAWNDVGSVEGLSTPLVGQYWTDAAGSLENILAAGGRLIMSPPSKTYLDLKHTPSQSMGVTWAGLLDARTAYTWDPIDLLPPGASADCILGIEAALWTETVEGVSAVETMLFPRACAVAERAWSPRDPRPAESAESFLLRLAQHGARWTQRGVCFFPDPSVPWDDR